MSLLDPVVHPTGYPLAPRPGTYALILNNDRQEALLFGRSQNRALRMRKGFYVYVGSALGPGGLRARVARHCNGGRARHWHIDYLSEVASVRAVWYRYEDRRLEHEWAATFLDLPGFEAVPNFGCSDCRCRSHLFYRRERPSAIVFARAIGTTIETSSFPR